MSISPSASAAAPANLEDEMRNLQVTHPHYIPQPNEVLKKRYEVIKLIGEGSYAQVFKAYDRINRQYIAIKIAIADDFGQVAAKEELKILHLINKHESRLGTSRFVKCLDDFIWKGRSCLVLELLQENLQEFISKTHTHKLKLNVIQNIGLQLFHSLRRLSHSDVDVIHGDIKMDNILLCQGQIQKIKICDFGIAQQGNHKNISHIQNFLFRAPEVFLGLKYNHQIDVWSVGCLLSQLFSGTVLFMGESEDMQMNTLISKLGMPEKNFLDRCPNTCQYFVEKEGKYVLKNDTLRSDNIFVQMKTQENRFKGNALLKYELFQNLLMKIFTFDPETRITASAAISHPFFKN